MPPLPSVSISSLRHSDLNSQAVLFVNSRSVLTTTSVRRAGRWSLKPIIVSPLHSRLTAKAENMSVFASSVEVWHGMPRSLVMEYLKHQKMKSVEQNRIDLQFYHRHKSLIETRMLGYWLNISHYHPRALCFSRRRWEGFSPETQPSSPGLKRKKTQNKAKN